MGKKVEVKTHPRTKQNQMLQAFKLFNHVFRGYDAKHIDGDLLVNDKGQIAKDDLLLVMETMRSDQLTHYELDHLNMILDDERFSVDEAYVNYVDLCKALS